MSEHHTMSHLVAPIDLTAHLPQRFYHLLVLPLGKAACNGVLVRRVDVGTSKLR